MSEPVSSNRVSARSMRRARRSLAGALIALHLLASSAVVHAETPVNPDTASIQTEIEGAPDRPWSKGTTTESRAKARELFQEANALLKDGAFAAAAVRYQEALSFWDHPGIHYNRALALINLEQLVDVRRELIVALRYGPAPLDQDKFDHAQSYLKLIEQQLTQLEVSCDVPGALVSMDGQPLFTAPGHFAEFVPPGKHRISADKAGFETSNYDRTLLPGQKAVLRVAIFTQEDRTRYKRRWPFWVPAAITITGVATSVTGALFLVHAKGEFAKYDAQIDASPDCADAGCYPGNRTTHIKNNAERFQTAGALTLGLGGALAVGGGILMIMNIAKPYRVDPLESGPRVALVPLLSRDVAGIAGTARF